MSATRVELNKITEDARLNQEKRLRSLMSLQASLIEVQCRGKHAADYSVRDLLVLAHEEVRNAKYLSAEEALLLAQKKIEQETNPPAQKIQMTGYIAKGLAELEVKKAAWGDAIAHYEIARAAFLMMQPPSKEQTALLQGLYTELGAAYLKTKQYRLAAAVLKEAYGVAKKAGKTHSRAQLTTDLGMAQVLSGQEAEGFACLQEARDLYPVAEREDSENWAAHRFQMGFAYEGCGEAVEALAEYREALRLRLQVLSPKLGLVYYHSRLGEVCAGLARCCLTLNAFERAEKYCLNALESYRLLEDQSMVKTLEAALDKLKAKPLRAGTWLAGLGFFAGRVLFGPTSQAETTIESEPSSPAL